MGDSFMHVTCPSCQCKGLIDTAPLLSKARVVCVRCGTAYDALLVDGIVETVPAMTATDAPASKLEAAAQPSELTALVESDEVLTLPQTSEHKHQINETTVLDFAHPAQAEDEAQDSTAHTAASVHSDSQQADKLAAQQVDPMAESGEFEMPEEYVPQLSREADRKSVV